MNTIFKSTIKNKRAFTLVETLISLLIIALCFSLIQFFVGYLRNRFEVNNTTSPFNTYLRVAESDKYKFEFVEIKSKQLVLYSPKEGKEYRILNKNNTVRLTSENGGYIPLIDQVQRISWQYDEPLLVTTVSLEDGSTYTSKSFFPKNHKQRRTNE